MSNFGFSAQDGEEDESAEENSGFNKEADESIFEAAKNVAREYGHLKIENGAIRWK